MNRKERRSGAGGVNQRQFRAHSSTGWASASKVIVGLVDPILSNRAEDVDRERILEHLDLVLDPTWNLEHVTFAENNLAPIDRELQSRLSGPA